jgi:hypothetical protein
VLPNDDDEPILDEESSSPPPPPKQETDCNHKSCETARTKATQATLRPCIVRPGTLGRNPKVRFLLEAKSSTSSDEEEERLEQYTIPIQQDESSSVKELITYAGLATLTSIFREPCAPCTTEDDQFEPPSSKPPAGILLSQSSSYRSFTDSSVSSTMPVYLNPIDNDDDNKMWNPTSRGGGQHDSIAAASRRPSSIKVVTDEDEDSVFQSLAIVASSGSSSLLSTSSTNTTGSNPCQVLEEWNRREQRDLASTSRLRECSHQTSATEQPLREMPPPQSSSSDITRRAIVDWPLLGIRRQVRADTSSIEVVEIHGKPQPGRQWLEVTEIDL